MGYTHYFKGLLCTPELATFAQKAIDLTNVSICGGYGEGDPVVTPEKIWINGDESLGEDFETFVILDHEVKDVFPFCKTAHMPYDKVVVAILLAAMKLKAPGSKNIASDGSIADWIEDGGVGLFIDTYKQLYVDEPFDESFAKQVADQIGGDPNALIHLNWPEGPKVSFHSQCVLEKYDWSVTYLDDDSVELENYSPAGEDLVVSVPLKDFEAEVEKYAEDFDPEQHVESLLQAKNDGFKGVPDVFTLVEDAKDIKKLLMDLADELNGKDPEDKLQDETPWMIQSDDIEEELNTNEHFSKVPELSKKELQEIAENADDLLRGDDDVMQKTFDYIDEALSDFLREHYPEAIDDSEDDEEDDEE